VDDDADTRFLLETVLTDHGYPVLTANNGSEALDVIEQQLPALMLLDLQMPVLTGWETFAAIRAKGLSLPVVFLSGGINAAVQATAHYADGFLAKPFGLDAVLQTVETLLPAPQTMHQTRIAIVGFSDDIAPMLAETVTGAGFVAITARLDEIGDTPVAVHEFLNKHEVAVLAYDIYPPYAEHWALIAAVRAAEHERGSGRRFIAFTGDRRALVEKVGPTPAIALDGNEITSESFRQTLQQAVAV
jgi:CheY-like chemotaxis protein